MLDLSCVEQLVEISQTRAISDTLRHIKSQVESGRFKSMTVADIAMQLDSDIDNKAGGTLESMDAIALIAKYSGLLLTHALIFTGFGCNCFFQESR